MKSHKQSYEISRRDPETDLREKEPDMADRINSPNANTYDSDALGLGIIWVLALLRMTHFFDNSSDYGG